MTKIYIQKYSEKYEKRLYIFNHEGNTKQNHMRYGSMPNMTSGFKKWGENKCFSGHGDIKKKKIHILLAGKYSGTIGFAKQLGSSSNGWVFI